MSFQLAPSFKENSIVLGQFSLCQLLLINDKQYPWFILVPQIADIKEIYQLSEGDQLQLRKESQVLSVAIMDIFDGEKLNVAAIGNITPQLHVHHVVRFQKDACWPAPVWGQLPAIAYKQDEIDTIKTMVEQKLGTFGLKSVTNSEY